MAIEVETAEIQLDVVGQEAVQQTLDALGVRADQVNSAVANESNESNKSATTPAIDSAAIEAVQQTLNALLGTAGAANIPAESFFAGPSQENSPGENSQGEPAAIPPFDFSGLMATIERSNEILERIATAVESPPSLPQPTY